MDVIVKLTRLIPFAPREISVAKLMTGKLNVWVLCMVVFEA